MTDLQAKIDALPEWPKGEPSVAELALVAEAALARLALYSELAQARDARLVRHTKGPSGFDCARRHYPTAACTCGRDALLKALEVPRG